MTTPALTPTTPASERRPTLLVVDDTPANLNLVAGLLNAEFRVKLATNGLRALELAHKEPPDLILLDVMMPEIDGYEVCRRLKAEPATRDVPVIFITALTQPEDEARGFEVGAADFIPKPISPPTLRARVRTQLEAKAGRDALKRHADGLQAALAARLSQVERLRDATMFVMVSLAEFRDSDTGHHVRRTQEYVRVLAEYLRAHPGDEPGIANLDDAEIDLLARSAPLHDIGKVAIPDHILLKPGKLDADEFEVMKTHTLRGWEILDRAVQRMDPTQGSSDSAFLRYGMQIARHHHERWDGQGYPDRLAGRAIPLAARLMAVADVYDALISARPYKSPMSHEAATAQIEAGAGQHFDPQIVAAMRACEAQFLEIARQWRD